MNCWSTTRAAAAKYEFDANNEIFIDTKYIAFRGDHDWVSFTLTESVAVTMDVIFSDCSDIDLRYVLFDSDGNQIDAAYETSSQCYELKKQWELDSDPAGKTYYILIQDQSDDKWDLNQPYTVWFKIL